MCFPLTQSQLATKNKNNGNHGTSLANQNYQIPISHIAGNATATTSKIGTVKKKSFIILNCLMDFWGFEQMEGIWLT